MKKIKNYIDSRIVLLEKWLPNHYFQLALFNIILIILLLLRSAGYFEPYFPLSINFITLFSLVLAIFLFGLKSKSIFLLAGLFWIFACLLKLLNVEIWAERTAIYTFQAIFLGVVLLLK